MQRILILFLVLACGVLADGEAAATAPSTPDPGAKPALGSDTLKAVASDSLAKPGKDSSAKVAAPGMDTLAAGSLPAVSPEQAAKDREEMARDKARRDSLRSAREEAASSLEWHTVSDSGTSTTVGGTAEASGTQVRATVAAEPAVATGTAKRLPIPEVPQEREPRVLLWTGVGLAATGLLAYLIFTGNGKTPTQEESLDPVSDPTAGNSDAKTSKTMTIRWSH